MTTQDLVAGQKTLRSKLKLYGWAWLLLFIAVMGGILFFMGVVGGLGRLHAAYYLLAFLALLPLGLLSWSLDIVMHRLQRRCGVLCPQCQAALTGVSGQITVATGRCGHCGHRVIQHDAEPGASPNSGLATRLGNSGAAEGPPSVSLCVVQPLPRAMTANEFVTRQKRLQSKFRPWMWTWFLLCMVATYGTFVFLGIIAWLGKIHTAYYLLVLLLLLPFGLLSWALKKVMRRLQRNCGMLCPQCHQPLTGSAGAITITTGQCGHCGYRVIETDAQQTASPNCGPTMSPGSSGVVEGPPSVS